ncbi:MAG: hypothetical protein ACFCBU_02445 [Cyanophyceae cyanobacterium]
MAAKGVRDLGSIEHTEIQDINIVGNAAALERSPLAGVSIVNDDTTPDTADGTDFGEVAIIGDSKIATLQEIQAWLALVMLITKSR